MSWFKDFFSPESVEPKCVERSVYAALAFRMQRKTPVRIVISRFSAKPGTDHAQAQAFISGEWQWLQLVGRGMVMVGNEDKFGRDYGTKKNYKYLTLRDLMTELDRFLDNPDGLFGYGKER